MSTLSANPACNPACRACHYKELDYPAQVKRKNTWAATQLGQWASTLHPLIEAPLAEQLAYRPKSWMRAHWESPEGLSLGLNLGMTRAIRVGARWEQEFISWNTCPIHHPAIQTMVTKLRTLLSRSFSQWTEQSLEGIWFGAPHVILISHTPMSAELAKAFAAINWALILETPFNEISFHCNPQVGKNIFSHHSFESLYRNYTSNLDAAPVRAFRQVAHSLLQIARSSAADFLKSTDHFGPNLGPALVIDLYCGTGDFAQYFDPSHNWVGLELSSEAVHFANEQKPKDRAIHQAFVGTIEHRLRDPKLKQVLKQAATNSVALYLNPPRSGVSPEAMEQVIELIHEHSPKRIAYLSCSASSLARDLRALTPLGYKVTSLQPFDFFPQTEHFETLATLLRN